MNVNKSKIKENFLQEMQYGTGHIKYEYSEDHLRDIDVAIDEICDLSVEIISHLTEQETLVLRKRLGVYNNGEKQTLATIAKELDKTLERIRQIENKAYIRMINSIFRGSYIQVDNRTKMSSLTNLEEYANYHISKLGLDRRLMGMLSVGTNTLYDLLTYSYADFRKMGLGDTYYKQLSDKIHSLGLKFIEELTDEEKRIIVSTATKDMIANSSIDWISNLSQSTLLMLSKGRKNTIGLLREYIESGGKINEDAISYATSIGISIEKKSKLSTSNTEISIEELLDTSIKNIEMSTRLFNKLNRHGFRTIRDIVIHTTNDFDVLFNTGTKTKEEIFTLIHNFGLFFADELPTMRVYSNEISSQLDSTSDGTRTSEELLLERYKKLSSEKTQLEARTLELDSELSVVMEQLNAMGKEVKNGQSRK